ncbi:inactive protein RESTRICTED TEV MOVEMENT 2-like [Nicotiana tomentosiformis]|uniref:inactive protein RESTRICTED TEV MOVEMENT 2-like n=1 Tax=Nicotiana tomentosiformis TaxID=4098 RepID=UPI00388CB4C2
MDIKRVAAAQEYEDFVPTSMMVREKDYDTLLFNLSGFKKEQVKVQLCKLGILKISGQRPVYKWQRFQKDILVSENCDKSNISARFVNGNILCVKYPKLITSEGKKDKKLPASVSERQKKEEQATSQKTTLKYQKV